jgi:hypothetical protein
VIIIIKILNDILVLIDANIETDESSKTFIIHLTFRNSDYKIINQTLNYHNYNEAVKDFILLFKSVEQY